jgi:sterol desaturase/sphingolipid hydroxylase (fatty acid hydroxylase superfamily)
MLKEAAVPTPIEILLSPTGLTVLGLYLALMLWEHLFPGRELPRIRGWRLRGLAAFATYFYVSSYLPLLWDRYLAPYKLLDLTGLGVLGGAAAGILAYELVAYTYHRTLHGSTVLWRTFHQMHHSAERLDTYGAFYFSPLDMIGWTAVGSVGLALLVGIVPQAATVALLAITFLGIFQHTNIRTPRWLGYIVQRPESHTLHHGRGLHRYNYADLPLIDMLFGTFRNPQTFETETGFYAGASARIGAMLTFKDVSAPSHDAVGSVIRV